MAGFLGQYLLQGSIWCGIRQASKSDFEEASGAEGAAPNFEVWRARADRVTVVGSSQVGSASEVKRDSGVVSMVRGVRQGGPCRVPRLSVGTSLFRNGPAKRHCKSAQATLTYSFSVAKPSWSRLNHHNLCCITSPSSALPSQSLSGAILGSSLHHVMQCDWLTLKGGCTQW